MTICNNGRALIEQGHENSAEFELKINEMMNAWKELADAVIARKARLADSEQAHQVCHNL
jgi:spectrin beta